MTNNSKSKYKSGFTLVELLMVIAIVSILATIILSSLRSAREKALDVQIRNDISQVRNALELYANENNFIYPSIVANNQSDSFALNHANSDSIKKVGFFQRVIQYAFGEKVYAQSRNSNCQSFDNLQSALSPYIKQLPKHPLDDGIDVCYKYFSLSDGTIASVYTSLITEKYDNGINKQVGVVFGNTEYGGLMQLCQENLTTTNMLNGNSGAHPYPMFSGSDHCSGELADEVIGVASGNGQVTLTYQCTLSQYTNKRDCEQDRSYCSDSSYTDQSSCESNGVSTPGVCSGGSGYTDESSCTSAGSTSSGSCSGGSSYTDESSCTSAGYYASGECSGGSGYTTQSACTGAGETTPGYCSNSSYTDAASCTGAGTYTPGYCSSGIHTDASSCTGAGYFGSPYCSDSQYSTREDCQAALATWYQEPWISYGYSWTEPVFTSHNYTWTPGTFTSYNYTWTPTNWTSYNYTWTPGTWTSYNYTWAPGTYTQHTWTSVPAGSWNLY